MVEAYINPNLPVFADILGIILFSWMTYYFYKRSLKSPLSSEEKLLYFAVVAALVIDTSFVLSIIVLPQIFRTK